MNWLRLNLPAIGGALAALAVAGPCAGREGAPDKAAEAVRRMLEGYRAIDALLAGRVDIFRPGSSPQILELNAIVLCGVTPERRTQFADHIAATEECFYAQGGGEALASWVQAHARRAPHAFAAGILVQTVSTPQPFIEGNRRTATLLATYALARTGHPPLVITPATSARYHALVDPVKRIDRNGSLRARLALAQARGRLTSFLADTASPEFLAGPDTPAAQLAAGGSAR